MTGQQLRKELTAVDFGVKPTDREIPDGIAQGIIRFIARKHGITVDMEALSSGSFEEGDAESAAKPSAPAEAQQQQEPVAEAAAVVPSELHVLRKLTLEDVPKEAIERQARQMQGAAGSGAPRPKRRGPSARRGDNRRHEHSQEQIKKKEGVVLLPAAITVKEFAEKAGVQVPKVVAALLKNGVMATINQTIDYDTAAIVAAELEVTVAKEEVVTVEHLFRGNLTELTKDEPERLVPRAPIVVVMGHVDHGKTSLLDAIRKSDVVAGESGGITQHIGAYQVHHPVPGSGEIKPITFLDTPGHEAFTAMRARGARITDVAILVVSAEEGVKPTTVEAINHARAAEVPIMVALSKIDRPGADVEKVMGELAGYGLQPEAWGGSTVVVPYSAVTKQGIDTILESVLLLADLRELKANPNRSAIATVIESHLDTSHGPLATVVVNTGTLKAGDPFVCGVVAGKVRAMIDGVGQRVTEAGPSCPVRLSGFEGVPQVGDILQVMGSDREARDVASAIQERAGAVQKRSFVDLVSRLHEGRLTQLKIVLKADAQGSLEAIQSSLEQQATDKVSVKVIHAAVGAVTENDVMMAAASEGIVIAFHVDVPLVVRRTAEREGVQIHEHLIIYALFEEVAGLLAGLLEPEEREEILGHLEVKGVFLSKKSEQIIGGRVLDGVIKRVQFRLQRRGEVVGTGRISSLRKVDKDVKEVKEGGECGMRVEATVPVEVGDVLEGYVRELKKRE
jgi:translation initiation factor IF-2